MVQCVCSTNIGTVGIVPMHILSNVIILNSTIWSTCFVWFSHDGMV